MAASVIVFLSAVQIRAAVDFCVFPTLLLLLTLFRLSLNIASSRRILLHGREGTAAAGKVIEAFGQFVVGGNYVVGFVLFLALIAIQFLVVTHGAVRTAEVTARFTLDALPGKQMAIDADMNAGLIDEAEARSRRQAIAREAEFYGAMDGAARFNQRDALATILITAINIVAGTAHRHAAAGHRPERGGPHLHHSHRRRRPGDDDSLAAGLGGRRHHADSGQLGRRAWRRDPPATVGSSHYALPRKRGLSNACVLSPACPRWPFCWWPAGCSGARGVWQAAAAAAPEVSGVAPGEKKKGESASAASDMAGLLRLEDLTLEIGFQLIPLVDEKQGGQLLSRVRALRRHLSAELGFLVPPVHISDNLRLKPREYVFSLRGVEIGRWQTEAHNCWLSPATPAAGPWPGEETREPAFGVPAVWIAPPLGGAGHRRRILGGRRGHGHYHPPRRADPPACGRVAGPRRDQAADGRAEREPSQAD